MSLIVAIKDTQRHCAWIGADSKVSQGGSAFYYNNTDNCKFWACTENAFMGSVGQCRIAQLAEVNADLLIPDTAWRAGVVDYAYLVNNFQDNLVDLLASHNIAPQRIVEDDVYEVAFQQEWVICNGENLYEIGGDGSVIVHDDYICIGSGAETIRGLLEEEIAAHTKHSADIIALVLENSSKNTNYVGGQPVIACTSDEAAAEYEEMNK